jgi:hypothetical protein
MILRGAIRLDLVFRVEGNTIHGKAVTLIKQVGGNLETAAISPTDF